MQHQRTYLQRGSGGTKELKRKREAFQTEQQLFTNIHVRPSITLMSLSAIMLTQQCSNQFTAVSTTHCPQLRTSFVQAAGYHRQRLLELLQDAEDRHDHHRTAMVAAALLAAQVHSVVLHILLDSITNPCLTSSAPQDYKHVPGPDKTPNGLWVDYFQQVGAAGYEVLYHQASFDELKRYLRKLQNHQPVPEDAEIVLLELTYLLAENVSRKSACHFTSAFAMSSMC